MLFYLTQKSVLKLSILYYLTASNVFKFCGDIIVIIYLNILFMVVFETNAILKIVNCRVFPLYM